jgi:hypothetical protein
MTEETLMGTLTDVKDTVEAIKGMLEILARLTPDKAVVLEVQNLTAAPLRLVSQEHSAGGFAENPSPAINPGQADIFGSKDDGLAGGTKGRVTYESDAGFLMKVGWSNPFGPGDPDATSSVVGDHAASFEVTDIAGVGNIAQMQYVVRPGLTPGLIVRKGTANDAGKVFEIAAIRSGPRALLTAVRSGNKTLKLIQWAVNDDGGITRVGDSASAAGEASSIDVARGRLFVTACRSSSGNLLLISWEVGPTGAIIRRGDSRTVGGDQAGDARNIRIVALSETLFVTAVRTESGKLMLITWRLDASNELIRMGDSGDAAGEAHEISLVNASPDPSGNHRVITAVRGGDSNLVLITWSVSRDGTSIRRLSFDHAQAGGARMIQTVMTSPTRLVTSLQRNDRNLLVISWSLDDKGTLTRLGDSASQAGRITANSLMSRPGGVLSAVRASDGLRLIKWQISSQGAIKRLADSGAQAGDATLIALNQDALAGAAPIVTAVATTDRNLRLISWSDAGG